MSEPGTKHSSEFQLKWQNDHDDSVITISTTYFEHLLNCLANQKFIEELDDKTLNENQSLIDKAWNKGMFILGLKREMENTHQKMYEEYCGFWNNKIPFILNSIDEDINNNQNDENIQFKWSQLVSQEIKMWISLCCFSDEYGATVDCENQKYTHGQVSIVDFANICDRRGFKSSMINFMVDVLKHIGIGDHLEYVTKQ